MFLHELPLKSIARFLPKPIGYLSQAGIMLHMELPPNDALAPYDAFYLDWDGDYNNEPYYKTFRDQNYRELCATAGFADNAFFEAVMPRYTYVAEEDFAAAVGKDASFDEDTGRLSDVIEWYGFRCEEVVMSAGDGLGRSVRGGREAFFEHADSDRLLAMLMRFMSEHWALRERVHLLEQLLVDKGVTTPDELAALNVADDADSALDAESFAFIDAVVGAAQNIKS